jgi:hypothetical protein
LIEKLDDSIFIPALQLKPGNESIVTPVGMDKELDVFI